MHGIPPVKAFHLAAFAAQRQAKIAQAQDFKRFTQATLPDDPKLPYMLAVADYVIAVSEAALQWARSASVTLSRTAAATSAQTEKKKRRRAAT